jgi:catalase-peroxidase
MLKKRNLLFTAMIVSASSLLPTTAICADDAPKTNEYWWPKKLDLTPLRQPNPSADPMGKQYNYAQAFNTLDLNALQDDLKQLMTQSQDWWPADYGHYGPFFIRMSWHSDGTYRTIDGRGGSEGGNQRFAPLNSWPDNANLDKARRLLWPIKQKYGDKVSWSDLLVLAGNVAMDSMGFKTIGFAGGRIDDWQSADVNWGPEGEWLGSNRETKDGKLEKPFGATQMGLIYVNPEGPNGKPDPLAAAKNIRETFGRMAMNDEETVALIAGGHAFGKAHGAASAAKYVGPAPEAAPIQEQGFGWKNSYGTGKGDDTITSGLEGAWSVTPIQWSNSYLQNLYNFNWVQTKSPGGAIQWVPENNQAANLVPDAHDPKKRHAPIMFTTDLALKEDPIYGKISKRFLDDPKALEEAFAKAWFKLIHRDMGPTSRYLGPLVPKETWIWQDPVPSVDYKLIDSQDAAKLKGQLLDSGLTVPQLVKTAWASASTFRGTDKRGGANGARIRLLPQKNWQVNNPEELAKVLKTYEGIQKQFNDAQTGGKKISIADLIILGGAAGIEKAAKEGGHDITVPFTPGRTDALQAQTDINSFAVLKPTADGFRNYFNNDNKRSPTKMLVEKASMLNLSIPEMTVLIGGMRSLNANANQTDYGVFTKKPGVLTNDYFVNLLDMSTVWKQSATTEGVYDGFDSTSGQLKWKGTSVDLIFGSNSELRAVAEVYATNDAQEKFINDFVSAWVKVMMLDRFDLKRK